MGSSKNETMQTGLFTHIPKFLILPLLLGIASCSSSSDNIDVVSEPQNPENNIELIDIPEAFYSNPKPPQEMGDPYIVKHDPEDEYYYLYATHKANIGAHAWRSENLIDWEPRGVIHPVPDIPWASGGVWGPKVHKHGDKYYLYYSARLKEDEVNTSGDPGANRNMIGVAVGDGPEGPFVDIGHPLFDNGYAVIDNHIFIDDDGSKYFMWSRDVSHNIYEGRHESHMYISRLADDMLSLVGDPVLLTRPEQEWEFLSGDLWRWNEGNEMVKYNGKYYFMWTANYYQSKDYSVGFAVSDNPLGPFVKSNLNPILKEYNDPNSVVSGPGNNKVFKSPDGSEYWTTYHSHVVPGDFDLGWNREVNIDRMGFRSDGTIYINGPTRTSQPYPSGITDYVNIASEATVSTSSTTAGYSSNTITDGEIGIWERYEKYEWLSEEREHAWVELEWEEERTISCVLIYDSAVPARMIKTGTLEINGKEANISFSDTRGEAGIACFEPILTSKIRFRVDEMLVTGQEPVPVGLSEIMVLSKN